MGTLLVAILGLAFGAGDQYLGSRSISLGPWSATVAQISAPWLILPFLVGMRQVQPRRAAALGLLVTVSALIGYFAMTYSPIEIHPWTLERFRAGIIAVTTTGYNPAYILVGIVTGPLFGVLGQQWRARRYWVGAVLVAGALCLEPLARSASGTLGPPAQVWVGEVAVGLAVTALFVVRIRTPLSSR